MKIYVVGENLFGGFIRGFCLFATVNPQEIDAFVKRNPLLNEVKFICSPVKLEKETVKLKSTRLTCGR